MSNSVSRTHDSFFVMICLFVRTSDLGLCVCRIRQWFRLCFGCHAACCPEFRRACRIYLGTRGVPGGIWLAMKTAGNFFTKAFGL